MNDFIYYCENNGSTCKKKDKCVRYLKANEHVCKTTLFKQSCTKDNEYILYMEDYEKNNC